MDINRLPSFSPDNLLDDTELDALSLFLAKKLMDKIEFINRGREGITVELLKLRASSHVRSLIKESGREDADPGQARVICVDNYNIRPAVAGEALEISRCAHSTYGYTYEDYIYYPERITEMNRNKELISLVAVSNEGIVMGHCALKFAPGRKDRAELGVLFVNPKFRENRLGGKLWKAVVDLAREKELDSIFSRSVTGHAASQLIAEQNGFSDCALFLDLFPEEVNLKHMGGLQKGKMSGMFQWRYLKTPRKRRIELPDPYVGIVSQIYERAGVNIKCHTVTKKVSNTPILRIQRVPVLNVGILEIESSGSDAEAVASWVLLNCRRLCSERLDVIYLYINIEEMGAALIAEKAANNGFIFSGISPDAFAGGDAIVLQYLNFTQDPFETMTVWTDTAAILLDFIQKEWRQNEI